LLHDENVFMIERMEQIFRKTAQFTP
jgi:hypothetical protein